jgi:hypothetical protein
MLSGICRHSTTSLFPYTREEQTMKNDDPSGNARKLQQLKRKLAELLEEILQPDFFGTAGIVLNVQGGTIQNIHRHVEWIDK